MVRESKGSLVAGSDLWPSAAPAPAPTPAPALLEDSEWFQRAHKACMQRACRGSAAMASMNSLCVTLPCTELLPPTCKPSGDCLPIVCGAATERHGIPHQLMGERAEKVGKRLNAPRIYALLPPLVVRLANLVFIVRGSRRHRRRSRCFSCFVRREHVVQERYFLPIPSELGTPIQFLELCHCTLKRCSVQRAPSESTDVSEQCAFRRTIRRLRIACSNVSSNPIKPDCSVVKPACALYRRQLQFTLGF